MEVGGRNIGEYLAKLINLERGTNLNTTPQMELVQSIKERFASVEHGAAGAVKNGAVDKIFELSDGQTIELGSELWRCSEVLFDPTLVSSASTGIHQLVATTVSRLDPDILTETEGLIFTAGGGSGLRGLDERLEQELELLNLEKVVQVMTSDENAAWIGGSLFAEQSNFSNYCVTEDLYFEHGSPILHRMF